MIEFNDLLTADGYVVFTIMNRRNEFARYAKSIGENGLERIVFPQDHRFQGEQANHWFAESEHHLKWVFRQFECVMIGYYDLAMDIMQVKSTDFHYIFIGKKKCA